MGNMVGLNVRRFLANITPRPWVKEEIHWTLWCLKDHSFSDLSLENCSLSVALKVALCSWLYLPPTSSPPAYYDYQHERQGLQDSACSLPVTAQREHFSVWKVWVNELPFSSYLHSHVSVSVCIRTCKPNRNSAEDFMLLHHWCLVTILNRCAKKDILPSS